MNDLILHCGLLIIFLAVSCNTPQVPISLDNTEKSKLNNSPVNIRTLFPPYSTFLPHDENSLYHVDLEKIPNDTLNNLVKEINTVLGYYRGQIFAKHDAVEKYKDFFDLMKYVNIKGNYKDLYIIENQIKYDGNQKPYFMSTIDYINLISNWSNPDSKEELAMEKELNNLFGQTSDSVKRRLEVTYEHVKKYEDEYVFKGTSHTYNAMDDFNKSMDTKEDYLINTVNNYKCLNVSSLSCFSNWDGISENSGQILMNNTKTTYVTNNEGIVTDIKIDMSQNPAQKEAGNYFYNTHYTYDGNQNVSSYYISESKMKYEDSTKYSFEYDKHGLLVSTAVLGEYRYDFKKNKKGDYIVYVFNKGIGEYIYEITFDSKTNITRMYRFKSGTSITRYIIY